MNRRNSFYPIFGAVLLAACGSEPIDETSTSDPHPLIIDYGDAVGTAELDAASGVMTSRLENPDQTETLLELTWSEDGITWHRPKDGAGGSLPASDVRLESERSLLQTNQVAYEQWRQLEEQQNCHCAYMSVDCTGIWVCQNLPVCMTVLTCDENGCVEEQECNLELQCQWEETCYLVCQIWYCEI